MKKLFVVVSAMLFFSGCAARFGQVESTSHGIGNVTHTTETFVIAPINSPDTMGLKVGHTKVSTGVPLISFVSVSVAASHFFRIEVLSTTWEFADDIVVKIDNELFILNDLKLEKSKKGKRIFTYDISQEILEKLKKANSFSVELSGREITLTDKELRQFKNYLRSIPPRL
ncbi:MAG: hypothetical protein LBI42_15270 [Chitinispirillales bacterium]|nr:hypothetical protein [Chitinispirillales bacterium]